MVKTDVQHICINIIKIENYIRALCFDIAQFIFLSPFLQVTETNQCRR
jgi:hypothetical protein